MLKKICGLFLGLMVLIGSACVTPTHASSAQSVILTYVQAGSGVSAKDEAVVLYNHSAIDVDISNWCLVNKTDTPFYCFKDESSQYGYTLPGYSYTPVVSLEYANHTSTSVSFHNTYIVTNQSSGSIVGSSDTISLRTGRGEVIDNRAWSSSASSGKAWGRLLLSANPDIYSLTGVTADWNSVDVLAVPQDGLVEYELPSEPEQPDGPDEGTEEPALDEFTVRINELLPNPDGTDPGNEFIELFNPSPDTSIELSGYSLHIGQALEKTYSIPTASISALGYLVITNIDKGYSLLNSSSKVQLFKNDEPIGEAVEYVSPKSGESWALFDDSWLYTYMPTPGAQNEYVVGEIEKEEAEAAAIKPCAANQYRSAETGRCRNNPVAILPTACKEGQYRSLETNRCRSVASVANTPAPCKTGQERSAETNRCRNVASMSKAGQGVKGIEAKSEGVNWYMWVAIGGIVAAIIGYGVWEWRDELKRAIRRVVKFARTRT